MSDELQRLLESGRTQGVYTGASLCVVRDGSVVIDLSVPEGRHLFDLASLTKAFTAIRVLQERQLDDRIDWLQGAPSVGQLLSHSSGLPAWRPLFAHAARRLNTTVPQLAANGSNDVVQIFRELIATTPTTAPRPTYSDLGFIALGIEVGPLFRRESHAPHVPTGVGRPRQGNPDVEPEAVRAVAGDPAAQDDGPDDDNAACLAGLAGHAGSFSTAMRVARMGDRLRRDAEGENLEPWFLSRDKAELMFTRVAGSRTYGLDTPSGDNPSIGSILGRGPKGAAGHLGFTGCSLWIDRDAKLSIAFLTNAVLLERPSSKIRSFRPSVHDAVARSLGIG